MSTAGSTWVQPRNGDDVYTKYLTHPDIKGFFDNIPQDLLLRAVKKHAKEKWMVLYIERWLKAPIQEEDGQLVPREKGTPQGGVISPLLARPSQSRTIFCES